MGFKERQIGFTFALPCRIWPICIFIMVLFLTRMASAQQAYNNVSGYECTGKYSFCSSYTLYRTQGNETLKSVANLFNSTASRLANSSGLNLTTAALSPDTPLYVYLSCKCLNGTYQAQVTHSIVSGDTFTGIANNTYQGMTTWQAIEAANPKLNATTLAIGDVVTVPLRCACPSAPQIRNGSRLLLSYVIFPQETLGAVSNYFNVSIAELQAANDLTNDNIQAFSTLLVPLPSLPPLSSISFIVPQSPAPTPSTQLSPAPAPVLSSVVVKSKGSSNTPLYIGVAVGAFGLILAAIFAFLLASITRRQHKGAEEVEPERESERSLRRNPADDITSGFQSDLLAEMSEFMGADRPTMFTYEELQNATHDFSDDSRIQGSVFLGKLQGMLVAIKQMKGNMTQELKILSHVHHGNVVRLVGICVSSSEHLFLVYEYAENGSLSDCLHNQVANPSTNFSRSIGLLSWTTRVQIALDVASGLEYIHNYTNPSFVHKDVKSSNILLDRNFRAKVANFGMAKSADTKDASPMLTNHIVGTQGYMAPEYLEHGLVTTKADVFSFGVVLLEMLSGQEAIVKTAKGANGPGKERTLSSMVFEVLEGDNQMLKLQAWMDLRLQNAYPAETAFSVASLAKSCVDNDPALRPSMKDITYALSKMLSASLEWESSTIFTSRMSDVSLEAR